MTSNNNETRSLEELIKELVSELLKMPMEEMKQFCEEWIEELTTMHGEEHDVVNVCRSIVQNVISIKLMGDESSND